MTNGRGIRSRLGSGVSSDLPGEGSVIVKNDTSRGTDGGGGSFGGGGSGTGSKAGERGIGRARGAAGPGSAGLGVAGLNVTGPTGPGMKRSAASRSTVVQNRRVRLHQLLELTQAAHGWSRRRLGRALGRNPSRLVPESGIPKLDLVMKVAELLRWSASDVISYIWGQDEVLGVAPPRPVPDGVVPGALAWAAHSADAGEAHRRGLFRDALTHAREAWRSAVTPAERALARNRESGAWDGMGCYLQALTAARAGLCERTVPGAIRRMLQANLANAYYGLAQHTEARAVARQLLDDYESRGVTSPRDRKTRAFAAFVFGQTIRRRSIEAADRTLAREARQALRAAWDALDDVATALQDPALAGMANTVRGALIEVDALVGRRTPRAALDALCGGLDAVVDCGSCVCADWLESYGWWCVSGCTVATRMLPADRDAECFIAVLTNKGDEIAERLGNWSIRERILTVQYLGDAAAGRVEPVLDEEDIRQIAGTMGRFPQFRQAGWGLLRSSRLVSDGTPRRGDRSPAEARAAIGAPAGRGRAHQGPLPGVHGSSGHQKPPLPEFTSEGGGGG